MCAYSPRRPPVPQLTTLACVKGEELDEDRQLADALTTFEQELVAEEETFMAAIGIKKLALPKPRVPARPPKPQPPQSYEIDQRVVANWNGQLTLAKVRPSPRRCHVVTACRHVLSLSSADSTSEV